MSQLLYAVPLLACPVGMGLMMYFMMRGSKQDSPQPPIQAGIQPTTDASAELTQLRAEVDQLRAAQQERERISQAAAPERP